MTTTAPAASTPAPAPARETKAATLARLLARKAGADLAELQAATGWQPHSVRAALSGLRKAGYTLERTPGPKPDSLARYRITGRPAGRP